MKRGRDAEQGPGKSTLAVQFHPAAGPAAGPSPGKLTQVQLRGGALGQAADIQSVASAGVAGSGGGLPHLAAIQRSFGDQHDVSGIRAHVGGDAAASCDAIGASAYATGSNVAFQSSPDLHTAAHEAAHVIQQRHGVQLKGGVGEQGDVYEQHADAVADLVVQGKSASGLLDTMAGGHGASGAAVQRAAKQSHYGTFTDEKYAIDGAKLHMTLKFTPNDQVDATKIGMTQSIRAVVAGNTVAVDPNAAARMTPGGDRIDRISNKNTPMYGSDNLGVGQGLQDTAQTNNTTASPTELNPDNGRNATYDLGHHFKPGGVGAWNTKDAGMYDGPTIQGGNNSSNEFETTALALDGAQKGEYYGSVKWGWKKDGAGTVSKVDFDIVSMGVPSKTFLAAATKWNAATTRGTMEPVANGTKVLDGALAEKFTIDTGVEVTYTSSVSAGDVYYAFITIKSAGAHHGETGYVKVSELKDKGDGAATVDLPTVAVQVVTAQTPLYADNLQARRLQSLAKDTRVKVLATRGVLKQIQIVDGPDTGKTGWAAADKLVNEA